MTQPLWLVVFADFPPAPEKSASWQTRLAHRLFEIVLAPGFRHVFAAREIAFGARAEAGLLVVNPHWRGADVMALAMSDPMPGHPGWKVRDWWLGLLNNGALMLGGRAVWCRAGVGPDRPPLAPLSCVSVIQHLLGLRGLAFTPRQLYRLILNPPRKET